MARETQTHIQQLVNRSLGRKPLTEPVVKEIIYRVKEREKEIMK